MTIDQWVALFSASTSFAGLFLVVLQLRDTAKKGSLESLVQIYDVNRQLLSLGFSHPQLFNILVDATNVDPEWERRYLQLWLNQLSLIHSYLKHGEFDREFNDGLKREIADLMTLRNMQRHWKCHGEFYPPSFQALVNDILSNLELSPVKAVGS
jgi:hypothetical protein